MNVERLTFTLGSVAADVDATCAWLAGRGMADATAREKAATFARCAASLIRSDADRDRPAVLAWVPGRIEVFGKHTDYCGGRSLLCTVDRGFCCVAASRDDAELRLSDPTVANAFATVLDPSADLPALPGGHWGNYISAVARRVARNFPGAACGTDVALTSDLPPAAGLSSSSALIVAVFALLSAVNDLPSHPAYKANIRSIEDLAAYLGCNENGSTFRDLAGDRGVGTFGGSQDHTAILCSKADAIVQYGFCPVERQDAAALPADVTFLIVNSGVLAEKTGAALARYNAVAGRVRELVALWNADESRSNVTYLREIVDQGSAASEHLRRLVRERTPAEKQAGLLRRFEQFEIEANEIIPAARATIAAGDWAALGTLTDRSHALANTHLDNQVPETMRIQRELREAGALAASAFGAGFGGSVWGLVRREALDDVRSRFQSTCTVPTARAFATPASIPACVAAPLSR